MIFDRIWVGARAEWVHCRVGTQNIYFFFYFRLESVAVVIADGLEDPLDDVGMVTQQLDQISGELKFFKIFKFRMPGIESR